MDLVVINDRRQTLDVGGDGRPGQTHHERADADQRRREPSLDAVRQIAPGARGETVDVGRGDQIVEARRCQGGVRVDEGGAGEELLRLLVVAGAAQPVEQVERTAEQGEGVEVLRGAPVALPLPLIPGATPRLALPTTRGKNRLNGEC